MFRLTVSRTGPVKIEKVKSENYPAKITFSVTVAPMIKPSSSSLCKIHIM